MKPLSSPQAPAAIGPYAQAIQHGDLIFCSGQIAIDPTTNQIVEGGIVEQTVRVLENIKGLLEDNGSGLEKVIKATVYLKNMDDFGAMNEVYAKYFSSNYPARSAVEVSRLPKDVLVEIEVVAGI